MRAWPAPEVPTCPSRARRSRSTTPPRARWSRPRPTGPARLYVCGITPYDATHMGHARDLRRLRPAQPGLAQRRPRGRLRPERHRRRRPAARAGRQGARRLDRARRARDRAVPPGHDRAAGAAARRTTSAPSSRSRWSVDADRAAPGGRRGLPGRGRPLLLGDRRPGVRRGVRLDREKMLEIFPERGGDPDRAGQEGPARLRRLARPARGRAVVGEPARARAGPAGTSSAPRSPASTSAAPSTSRAAAATWSSRTTRCAPATPRWPTPAGRSRRSTATPGWSAYDGEKMSKSQRQPGLRLRAAQQRRRPDGDPAGAAAPPLPLRLGVDRRRALGRRRHLDQLAPGALARRRCPRGAGGRPRCWPRWPTTSTPRARWPPSSLGRRHARHRRPGRHQRPRRGARRCSRCSTPPSGSRSDPAVAERESRRGTWRDGDAVRVW